MSQQTKGPYSADQVAILIGNPLGGVIPLPEGLSLGHTITGRGTDAFLSVAREGPVTTKTVGADGEAAPSIAKNASGSFTITVLQTSVSNTILSSILTAWENEVARFYFPVTVVDTSSQGSLYEAEQCWIQGWPEAAFGVAVGQNTWVIETGVLRMFHGSRG